MQATNLLILENEKYKSKRKGRNNKNPFLLYLFINLSSNTDQALMYKFITNKAN